MARICAITGRRPVKGSIINRKGQSKKSGGIGTHVTAIRKMLIWGNHSATQYPDITNTLVQGKAAKSLVTHPSTTTHQRLTPEARAVWERLGAVFITAKPDVQMAHQGDRRDGVICVGDTGNRLKDWFARWPKSVAFVRPDRFVGALCAPQEVSATTLAFARALHLRQDA